MAYAKARRVPHAADAISRTWSRGLQAWIAGRDPSREQIA
jgi:hypothetical protein